MTNELGNFLLEEWNQKTMSFKDWRNVNLNSRFIGIGHVFFGAGFSEVELALIEWLTDAELGQVFAFLILSWSLTGAMSLRIHQEAFEFTALIWIAVCLEVISA